MVVLLNQQREEVVDQEVVVLEQIQVLVLDLQDHLTPVVVEEDLDQALKVVVLVDLVLLLLLMNRFNEKN